MLKLDEFESVFKKASKTRYEYASIEIGHFLVVSDLEDAPLDAFVEQLQSFLTPLSHDGKFDFHRVRKNEYADIGELVKKVEDDRPDMIITYRNLGTTGWKWPYSLGEDLDVLTQATNTPVLVTPHPEAARAAEHAFSDTSDVLVVADHLTGDHNLVNYGVTLTEPGGRLFLTHVEPLSTFEYYMGILEKIPSIDSQSAREDIKAQLLKEPHDYVTSVAEEIRSRNLRIEIVEEVLMDHRLVAYRRMIEAHNIDLLILNAKDENHVAMHPMAYPLAVELDDIPILML